MNFTLIDVGGLLVAALAAGLVLVAPGMALARLFGLPRASDEGKLLDGVLTGLAVLPVLDSLATRFMGLDATLAMTLVLAVLGIWGVRGTGVARPSGSGLALAGAWLVLVAFETVDFDVAGKLYQPLSVFDMVKHAATTQAIYDSGAPPRDAFFLRPERASYYYFFYTLPALIMRLCGGLIDAKAAFAGMVFWTGIGAYALVDLAMRRARLGGALIGQRRRLLIVAVLAAGGLDILATLAFAWTRHYWTANPLQWNEQVGAWFEDVVWVPHHVAALIAGMVGLVALCDAIGSGEALASSKRRQAMSTILAGLCFAAALGLSVWVTFGFVATVLAWAVLLLCEGRWRSVGIVVGSGLAALLVALPQLHDLALGRTGGGGFPVLPKIRAFTPVELLVPDALQPLLNLLTLPLNYGFEFGVLAIGTFVFWRLRRARQDTGGGELHRVLVIMALMGLALGALLTSTLFNNDLGWRVLLLPLLAGSVWTIVALDQLLQPATPRRMLKRVFMTTLVLGWTTVLYTAIVLRAYPFMTVNPKARFIAADPATERALRVAFGWARGHLPQTAVLQQNPTFRRAFAFGMYGRNPVGVADSFASLYGADPAAVAARLDSVGPIFTTTLSSSEIGARAAGAGIDDLVVTTADPVWHDPQSFVWRAKPIFNSDRVRIIPVGVLEAAR